MKYKFNFAVAAAIAAVSGMFAGAVSAQDIDQGSVARGGKLYDKWYKVIKADVPEASHSLYPASNEKYANDPKNNWRCKECHGWDGRGVAGAYASGSHATGIKGIDALAGGDPAAVVAILTAPAHGYGDKMAEADLMDLANFVVYGQIDWSTYVDADTKAPKGDAAKGKQVYNTVCANCHGADGKLPKDMPPLGSLMGNPWEVMHKILNGQPAEAMPAMRAIDHQVSADVMTYLTMLPKE
ncbi:c-type cytochrome [Marimonas arenosa]|uniref:C-type cytochrome n=1 Tax=Marimonas arenosa TaxID=1795305 RepID=A0AAE4B4G9_9RHOB|nr:c-type cytochrome [Marimonas arenosa]MDQ2091038.1 c-type cytochrome [Marimonas arenosa]